MSQAKEFFNTSAIKLHQKVSFETIAALHAVQDYTRNGSQGVGDCVLWQNGTDIEDENHLKQAPERTIIQIRNHYRRQTILLQKLPCGNWHVTKVTER